MTREEAKKLMPVIQAFADGKDVEIKTGSDWMSIENMSFAGNPNSYRIKPEQKYRPFANAERSAGMKCKNISRLVLLKISTLLIIKHIVHSHA